MKKLAEKGKERAKYFLQERFNERFQKAIAKALELSVVKNAAVCIICVDELL